MLQILLKSFLIKDIGEFAGRNIMLNILTNLIAKTITIHDNE